MLAKLRSHLAHNVVGYIALFIALGGTSYAVATGSIDSREIKNGTIKSKDIKNNEIKGTDIRSGTLGPSDVGNDSLTGTNINEGTLGTVPTATNAGKAFNAQNAVNAANAQNAANAANADKLGGQPPSAYALAACPGGMVKVGSTCIDVWEASVWDAPTGGTQLTTEAQIDAACPDNGQPAGAANCANFYARSVPGIVPAHDITWFQAQQALANSGKRLPTNAEWQAAVSGTPDDAPATCNTNGGVVGAGGPSSGCVSRFGVHDMVGNVSEWVADWDEQANDCDFGAAGFGDDRSCVGAAPGSAGFTDNFPGALFRGGGFGAGTDAGPFAVSALDLPSSSNAGVGFRGAR